MVRMLRCLATEELLRKKRVARRIGMLVLIYLGSVAVLPAAEPGVHFMHHGAMPPGAIGMEQLQRGGPLPGYFQPVEIKAPPGALISLATSGDFGAAQKVPLRVGFLIGQVYRLRVMNIPLALGMEVFPTIEVIDRIYPPPGEQRRFAIPIELTDEDLKLALGGKFVTRVIYLEDPNQALPTREDPQAQNWFEVGQGQDPLEMADALGRPVAILRLGARLPDDVRGPGPQFLFGCPPFETFEPPAAATPARAAFPEEPQP